MGWFSKNILAKLGLDSGSDEDRLIDQLEQIRAAMLEALGDAGAEKYPLVVRRVFHSKDAQALWYARAELMAALADLHGERVAHQRMAALSPMFDGLLPKSLTARPTSLRG